MNLDLLVGVASRALAVPPRWRITTIVMKHKKTRFNPNLSFTSNQKSVSGGAQQGAPSPNIPHTLRPAATLSSSPSNLPPITTDTGRDGGRV